MAIINGEMNWNCEFVGNYRRLATQMNTLTTTKTKYGNCNGNIIRRQTTIKATCTRWIYRWTPHINKPTPKRKQKHDGNI